MGEMMGEDQIVEMIAHAIKESTGMFYSPVRLYISGEARSRWELVNPGGDWYDTAESRDELADYKIIARSAWNAAKAALAEAGPAMLNAGADALTNEYADHPEWDEAKDVIEGLNLLVIFRAMIAAAPDQR